MYSDTQQFTAMHSYVLRCTATYSDIPNPSRNFDAEMQLRPGLDSLDSSTRVVDSPLSCPLGQRGQLSRNGEGSRDRRRHPYLLAVTIALVVRSQ